jgi:hypothetical protein
MHSAASSNATLTATVLPARSTQARVKINNKIGKFKATIAALRNEL